MIIYGEGHVTAVSFRIEETDGGSEENFASMDIYTN
jgi:hypothetical protein